MLIEWIQNQQSSQYIYTHKHNFLGISEKRGLNAKGWNISHPTLEMLGRVGEG